MDAASWLRALDGAGFGTLRVLLSVLWQSSILLGAAGLLVLLLRRRSASLRHAVWVAALCAAPVLPLLAWAASGVGTPRAELPVMPAYEAPVMVFEMAVAPAPMPITPLTPPVQPSVQEALLLGDYPWALGLLGYASVAGAFLVLVLVGRVRIGMWLRRGSPAGGRLTACFEHVRQAAGLRRPVRVIESEAAPAPMTVGALRPAVLLPAGLAEGLSDAELRAVAVHEVAHVKRRDPLVLTVVSLVRAALFFHPLVWLGARQVSNLAEGACDDAVLGAGQEPVSYARMLARLAEELPHGSVTTELAAGIVLSKRAFLRRVQAILSDRRDRIRKLSRLALAATLFGALLSLGVALAFPLGERPSTDPTETLTAEPAEGRGAGSPVATDEALIAEEVSAAVKKVDEAPEGTEAKAAAGAGEAPSFGPVVEQVVHYDPGDDLIEFIDFDTGRLLKVPPEMAQRDDPAEGIAWIRQVGPDASGSTEKPYMGLTGFDMIVYATGDADWDKMSAEELRRSKALAFGEPGLPVPVSAKGELPATYLFKTREGGAGILQIVGFTEDPKGVKIRYKMVQGAAGAKDTAEPRRTVFRGLDLSDAPRTSNMADLPDLLEERPAGSQSFELRRGILVARHLELPMVGEVYYVPDKDVFYVQYDAASSSTHTFYGPFEGKPWERLGIPEADAQVIGAQGEARVSFGLVIEREMNNRQNGGQWCLDLDTGSYVPPPDRGLDLPEEILRWAQETGADAVCGDAPSGSRGLLCFGMTVARLGPGLWQEGLQAAETAFRQLDKLAPGGWDEITAGKGELPATYLFKTREGGMGILQIVGFTDDPKGVKIRYKMVATEEAGAVAAQARPAEMPMGVRSRGGRRTPWASRVAAAGAIQVQIDAVAIVLKRSDLPADYSAFNNRQALEQALWHRNVRLVVANHQRGELLGLGGTMVRPIVSGDRRYVFVEVTLPSPGRAENAYGIQERTAFPVVEDGPQARKIAEAWIGAQEAGKLDLHDCAVVLLLKPTVIALPEGPERPEGEAATVPGIQVEMRLLEVTDEGERTLSAPRILLRDGQGGHIQIMTDRDYVSSPWTPDRPEPETTKVQTGVSWEVTPRIQKSAPDTIAVTISFRSSDIAGRLEGEGLAEVPVVGSREWQATILLKEGETKTIDIRPQDDSQPRYRLRLQARLVPLPASVPAGGGGAGVGGGFGRFNYPARQFWQEDSSGAPGFGAMLPESDRKVYENLDDRVSLAFSETRLADVVEFLRQVTPVQYVLFEDDLPADGAPVTLTVETTLRRALDLVCDLTEMDWKVQGGLIKIGAPETLAVYEWRAYEVRDLLLSVADRVPGRGRGGRRAVREEAFASETSLLQRAENLVLLIKQTCGAGTWMQITPGDVAPGSKGPVDEPPPPAARPEPQGRAFVRSGDPGVIVVIQSAEVHKCIEKLLRELRGEPREAGLPAPAISGEMRERLRAPVSLEFYETPLAQVVRFLQARTSVQYVLFQRDLPPDGGPVTLEFEGPLGDALDKICEQTGMAWKPEGPVIKVGAPHRFARIRGAALGAD